jgi:hypothetical protein
MVLRLAVSFLLGSAMLAPAGARELAMPAGLDARAFQKFIDTATYGDTIVVPPGDYQQAILRSGITLRSEKGPEGTILRFADAGEVDSLTVLDGFHLKGKARPDALVLAHESRVTVRNCVFEDAWSGIKVDYGDVRVESCEFFDCDHGIWMFESKGTVSGCTFRSCVKGLSLTSSSPRVIRSSFHDNSIGIWVKDHSLPSIGGSLVTANRFRHNPAAHIRNESYVKRDALRTWNEQTLHVPYNSWGTDCPSDEQFIGDVVYRPWIDASGENVLDECPPGSVPGTD